MTQNISIQSFSSLDYLKIPEEKIISRIKELKAQYGKRIIILGHHYQRMSIVGLSDFRGDSLELARKAAEQKDAEFIIFCGVNFMAESAAILAQPHQKVIHPEMLAGCPMADMAEFSDVDTAFKEIEEISGKNSFVPITYINSTAEIKAICGKNNGIVCTSSNAKKIMQYALEQNKSEKLDLHTPSAPQTPLSRGDFKVIFLPDRYLGSNTANTLGIPRNEIIVYTPKIDFGGNTKEKIKNAKVILWDGFCIIHKRFTVAHVKEAREKFPDAKIIVHPECIEEVVNLADANGSTGYIVKYVQEAPPGSTIVIGTEINLVMRLAKENPDKKIYPLAYSQCANMYLINPHNLCWSLEHLGKINVIEVPKEIKADAKKALEKMLYVSSI